MSRSRWRHLGNVLRNKARRARNWRRLWLYPKVIAVLLPIAFPLLALLVIVVRGSRTPDLPHLTAPKDSASVASGPSTTLVDPRQIQIPPVEGTTTTRPPVQSGRASISGTVTAPQGPAAGATVRIERIAAGGQVTDVAADAEGKFNLGGIAGGRYRVRAFLAPKLAQPTAEVFFLADGDNRQLDLALQSFDGLALAASFAPAEPAQNQPFTVAVRVVTRTVGPNGDVISQPVAGATVALTGAGGHQVEGPSSATTDATGVASFTLVCKNLSATKLSFQVKQNASDPGQTLGADAPACTPPPTTAPPPSSSSSSASSASSASTTTTSSQGNH